MPQSAEAFLEEAAPSAEDFLNQTPSAEEFLAAGGVEKMASATRHTVGVVGRAVAARDFAAAGYDAPDRSQLDDGYQPDESAMTNQAVAPAGVTRRAIQPLPANALLAPLLKFPRVTAQEVSDALSYLASASPDLTQEESEAVIEHTMKPGNLEKIIAGAQKAGVSVPEAFTSPLGIATLGTGLLPATAGRVVAGGFAVDMARHIPEQVGQLKTAIASGDSERITEASGLLLASGAMTAAAGRHALTKPKPKTPLEQVAPLTAEAAAKVAPVETKAVVPETAAPVIETIAPKVETTPLTTAAVESVKAKEPVEVLPEPSSSDIYAAVRTPNYTPAVRLTDGRVFADTPGGNHEGAIRAAKAADSEAGQNIAARGYITESGEFIGLLEVARREMRRNADLSKAKEPMIEPPAPTPAVATGESGSPPVPAGVPPTKPVVPQEPPPAKPEGERALTSEPVAKVQAEVSKVASEEGQRSAKDIKSELVTRLEKSIEDAPSEKDLASLGPGKRDPTEGEMKAQREQQSKVTIEIPGDGTFTVFNTKEALGEILRRAKQIATKPTPEPSIKTRGISKEDNAEVRRLIQAGTGETGLAGQKGSELAQADKESAYKINREIADLNQQLAKEQKALDKNIAKMGSMVPPPIVAEVTRKIGTRMAKIQDKIDALEKQLPSEPQGAIATPGPALQPAPASAPALPPKSQRQIITDIAQGLKLPIRFGRLRTNRFAGYFLKLQNLIGSKRANDIPIISHEAGHKLDATFNFSNDPALRAELEFLGNPASVQGSRSSWTRSKSLRYKRGEGVAEFVRHWLTDPAAAAQHAPNMKVAFEAALDSNKDFGDTMRQAQSDIQTWRNAEPQARLRSHISVGGNPNKTPYALSQLTRDLVDDLHFLRMAANDAKAAGTDLAPSQNPYTLARNLRGSYGMADSFIRSGVADFKTKEVTLGTSLQDALKPVAGRIADFRDWIIAKRAQELHGQGRETGLVDSDVQFTAAKFDGDAAFQDAFTKLKKWNDDLLQYAVDSGLVTQEGAAAMRQMNQDYVPLHRVFEVGAGEAPAIEGAGTGRGLNVGKPGSLKRLTGSARDIVDPLETMVRNAYALITASEKFAINRAVADMSRLPDMGKWVESIATPKERVQVGIEKLRDQLEANGADLTQVPDDLLLQFFQNSKHAPFGENVIKTVRDGKPEFYRLKRELFETFNALDLEDSGTLVRMLSAPSQVLRAGVVLDPSFALANVMRDAFTSAIVSRHGLLPFEATLRGFQAMLKNPKLVAEWEAAGGKNAIEANYFDRQKLQKFLAEKITKDLTPAERALVAVKSPLQALRWLISLSEEATRIGEYQKTFTDLRKSGMPEGEARRQAAFESRDRQDFAKGGAKTKIPRRLAAFWNAGIQGNVRLAQAFRERPMQTTMKGLAFITIPKLIEQSLNWNDDDYWDRPQWERDLFFLIPAGKGEDGHTRFIRIPTPFEAGVIFGTFPGRILQSVREASAENMKSFPAVALKQTIPNPTPQFALTIFEDFMVGKRGYDVYRGRQIVPESIAQLPADMQWTEQTSLTARKLGAALGFPPVKIDHIINQTTGGLGKQITHQIVDRAISVATGEERTAKGVVPGGRFVTTPASVSSQAIDDFYTTLDKVKTAAEGQKKGRDDELAGWRGTFESAARQMSAMRRAMRQTSDEAQKNAIAENILALARSTMEEFRKAKEKKQP